MTDHTQAALADLGARLVALVNASRDLGHETYAMTAQYLHGLDSTGELVAAVARGRSRDGDLALEAWMDEHGLERAPRPDMFAPPTA